MRAATRASIEAAAAAEVADRAMRTRTATLATATSRNHKDVNLSIMTGEVVGRPVQIDRNVPTSFRGQLHKATALDTVPPDPRCTGSADVKPPNMSISKKTRLPRDGVFAQVVGQLSKRGAR